jgi:hypothetical protein
MADEIDTTNDRVMRETERLLHNVRATAAQIPKGEPGECYGCGEHSPRLVNDLCAPCRDRIDEAARRLGR